LSFFCASFDCKSTSEIEVNFMQGKRGPPFGLSMKAFALTWTAGAWRMAHGAWGIVTALMNQDFESHASFSIGARH
jgi:hypothetical protein